ncbi:MAG TPA: RsmE family RNA methyltransferase [Candidatus Acidoferrales bacterium]|nr:RsmE family RNA methyltransferase [Candidatus Acidoferrales bacterium]
MPYFFGHRSGDRVQIEGNDARHLALSLRARKGEAVFVLEPPSRMLRVRLESVTPEAVTGVVEEEIPHRPEPVAKITMALAMLPASQLEMALSRCTELGAHQFILLAAARSVARAGNPQRWAATCREAAMLAGRFHVPSVAGPIRLDQLGAHVKLHRGATSRLLELAAPSDLTLAIGPEGGWSDDEMGGSPQLASLGSRNLRAENAAAAALTVALAARGEI